MRRWLWILPCAAALIALGLWWRQRGAEVAPTWRLTAVERKDVRATVSATGALEPVTTVEVGTQVSGTIQALMADFNDTVEQGAIIAKLDTDLLQADVSSASATVKLREAELAEARQDLKVAEALHGGGSATDQELLAAQTAVAVAEAQRSSARVSLERAQRSLRYATITAPISGTVIERAVEVGQTVNAGTSAPRLFLLAGDLATMQIVANVDESDIGKVKPAQAVEFTVAAFGEEVFTGVVRQVRLSAAVTDNVTSYPVVIDVDNATGRLMPGMTATVSFIVDIAPDALCVSNPALRFRPDEAQIAPGAAAKPEGKGEGRGRGQGRGRGGPGSLWVVGADGLLSPVAVETGLADATCTEIKGEGVSEGLSVVLGQDRGGEAGAGGSTSPFQSSSGGGRGPGGRRPGGF